MNDNPRMTIFPVPNLHPCLLIFCAIINFILPGVGVMVGACIQNAPGRFQHDFWIGITQLMLAFIIIGFIWAWINSFVIIIAVCKCKKNNGKKAQLKQKQQENNVNTLNNDVQVVKQKQNIQDGDIVNGQQNKEVKKQKQFNGNGKKL